MRIRLDPFRGFEVDGVSKVVISSPSDGRRAVQTGKRNRKTQASQLHNDMWSLCGPSAAQVHRLFAPDHIPSRFALLLEACKYLGFDSRKGCEILLFTASTQRARGAEKRRRSRGGRIPALFFLPFSVLTVHCVQSKSCTMATNHLVFSRSIER